MLDKKSRCKKCNSSQLYVRQKTNEKVCKLCGYVEKIEKNIEKQEQEGGNE